MATGHAVTLEWRDGRVATVRGTAGQTILAAAESADLRLPFGCRTGACASCVGRLLDGTVTYERPPRALKPRHVEAGFVLCCLARPRTACRIEVGADVHTDLVANPFE